MPLSQTAPMLPSFTQEQNVMEYHWEALTSTAISPTSSSDIAVQHNKIGSIQCGAALVHHLYIWSK